MKWEWPACFTAALALHGAVLFGIRMETPAQALPMAEDSVPVDVSLVEEAPEPAGPAATPAPTPDQSTPAPTPESTPEPTPEMSTPPPEATPPPDAMTEAAATPKPAPHPSETHHPTPHTAHGSAAAPASAAARLAPGTGHAGHGGAGGGATTQARYLSNPRPDYPPDARRLRQQGVVYLSVEVGADGRPTDVAVSRSSGFPELDQAAAAAVRRWLFAPARAGGLAMASHVEIPVRFSLEQ